jgi:predicted nucleic acid-binding protein
MRRVYLDSCIAIYYVEHHATLSPRVATALFPFTGAQPVAVFSDLTRMECRVWPLRQGNQALLARYDEFFDLPDCIRAAVDTAVFDLATELRAQHGLKTPDALHLATALRAGCEEFWTNDERLAKSASGRIGIVVFDDKQ